MSKVSQYLVLNNKNYFKTVDEYIELKQLFRSETFYEKLSLFMKLLGNLLISILWKSSSLSISFTIYRMIDDWKKYLYYLDIKRQIHEWKEIVHSVGGPFISTNDDVYQPYIYADGMQRLHNNLFGLSKERTKRLE